MTGKKVCRWFTIVDFDKEEDYLRQMHQEGWKLKKTNGFIYQFEKVEPADVIYKLDYREEESEKETYTRLFADYGWEYIQTFNCFSYFRKAVANFESGEEQELFSDIESKLDMIERVIKRTLGFQLLALFINVFNLYWLPLERFKSSWVIHILLFLVIFTLTGVLIYEWLGYRRLVKKFNS